MNIREQLGAQMMTVRAFAETPDQIRVAFEKVAAMGYKTAQNSGLGPIDAHELAQISKDTGVKIVCSHCDYDDIRYNLDRLMEEHTIYGCDFIGVGGAMPTTRRESLDGVKEFIEEYQGIAEKAKANGFRIGYHNHDWEFQKFGGKRIMDRMIEEMPDVSFIFDTYWAQFGGVDVVDYMNTMLKGKIQMLHLKDMIVDGNRNHIMKEILEGNLNFDGIMKAAKDMDVEYYLVEQDYCEGDPFDSLKISYDNIIARYGDWK